jgi:hypothetical protein
MEEQLQTEIQELIKQTLLQQKKDKYSFRLGDIVALSSHPFTSFQHDILIGGEPQLLSPLMIIVEVVGDSQNLYDENVGNQIQGRFGSTAQCKCIWYSSKSFQFEEAWISSKLLKKIKEKDSTLTEKDDNNYKHLLIGSSVTLCTARLELTKLKSSYKNEGEKERSSINPLLSFVSPIMQIIGTTKNDSKEPRYDSKTGNKKREVSELLIKCKWFNPSSEKMSEKLIPIEALTLIPEVDEVKLGKIGDFIKNNKSFDLELNKIKTIIKPDKIKFTHGVYYLLAYNFLTNKNEIISIDNNLVLPKEGSKRYSVKVPNFKDEGLKEESYLKQLEIVIEKAKAESHYIRIKYKDRNGNVTLRTIKDFKIEVNDGSYLVGYCMLRNAQRNFHFERIQFLEVLNLKQ